MERDRNKPQEPVILGLAGAIGSGKSTVAREFARLGWAVIDADVEIADALRRPEVKRRLAEWWGSGVLDPSGEVDRSAVARLVFADPSKRVRLESLLHPFVPRSRGEIIAAAAKATGRTPVGIVYDAPLLFEAGLDKECDAVAFVEAPDSVRLERVSRSRGWDAAELARREAAQWPAERKKALARFVINNPKDGADFAEPCRKIAGILLGEPGASRTRPG